MVCHWAGDKTANDAQFGLNELMCVRAICVWDAGSMVFAYHSLQVIMHNTESRELSSRKLSRHWRHRKLSSQVVVMTHFKQYVILTL